MNKTAIILFYFQQWKDICLVMKQLLNSKKKETIIKKSMNKTARLCTYLLVDA